MDKPHHCFIPHPPPCHTADSDVDSVTSWSVNSDDDVFEEDTHSVSNDEHCSRKRNHLSSVSDWILLGKYSKAQRTARYRHRVSPYKKPRSLDGFSSPSLSQQQRCPTGCRCSSISERQYQYQDTVRRQLNFDLNGSYESPRCRSRSEGGFNQQRDVKHTSQRDDLYDYLLGMLRTKREDINNSPSRQKEYTSYLQHDPKDIYHSQFNCTYEKCSSDRNIRTCSCSVFEKHVMLLAENAYKNIRRPDRSPQAFRRFRTELQQTNDALKESLDLLQSMKLVCSHNMGRTR